MAGKILFFLLLLFSNTLAVEEDEYALYDLVEELNVNFYDFFAISRNAETSEVRKAYRQLSLQWHPDKNKDPGAEEKFRNIASVYEVLKDPKLREKYNHILDYGLPDWKQPVYYYRKVRKVGLLEILLILMGILTVGHLLVSWASYWEKCYTLEENVRSYRKRKDRKELKRAAKVGQDGVDQLDAQLEAEIAELRAEIPRPEITELLPFMMVRGLIWLVCWPVKWTKEQMEQEELRKERKKAKELQRAKEEERERAEEERRRERRLQQQQILANQTAVSEDVQPVVYGGGENIQAAEKQEQDKRLNVGPWTSADMHLLAQAIARYPGGTHERWEKVSEMVNRPIKEVIKNAQNIKHNLAITVSAEAQGITGSLDEISSTALPKDGVISTRLEENGSLGDTENTTRRRGPTKVKKTAERTLMISSTVPENKTKADGPVVEPNKQTIDSQTVSKASSESTWSQAEQRALEKALQEFPKGCEERWEKIAKCVPGKSKEDCMARFQHLVKLIKQKRENTKQE